MSLVSFTREDGTRAWINPDLVVSAAWGTWWTLNHGTVHVSALKVTGLAVWYAADRESDYPHVYTGEDAKKVERILDRGSGG